MPAGIARLNPFDRPVIRPAYFRAIRALRFDPARFDPAQFDLTRFDPNDMDTAQFTHVSLCAGYGGIDLGLRRVLPGLRTIAYSEIEEYACGLLAARMESGHLDPAPIWSDLKTFPFREFHGCVDILSGGYPCQPFSAAGKRRGTDDPRHLWPYIADGIRLCQPRICFFENVEGHITLGLRDVLGDLERLGYQATWGIFSAAEVGAPHQRKRVFILAHNANDRFEQPLLDGKSIESTQGHSIAGGDLPRVADAAGNDTECPAGAGPRSHQTGRAGTSGQFAGSDGDLWPARPGEPQHGWEPPRVVANTFRNGRSKAERDAATMGGEESSEEGCKSESGRVAPPSDGGSSMGDAQSERSTALRSQYEGFLGELCAASPSGACGVGDAQRAERRPNDDWITRKTNEGSGDASSPSESVADSSLLNRQRGSARTGRRSGSEIDVAGGDEEQQRQAEPSLGGDVDGAASRLDYADLSIACDNRTDELRLLGNGVVPATAALAFRTLLTQLDHDLR